MLQRESENVSPAKTFQPLFPPDTFVDVDETDIDRAFLKALDTPHRRRLASQLRLFLAHLRTLGLTSCEIWIDGSFATLDPDPMDVDVVCFIPRQVISGLPDEQLEELKFLASEDGRPYVREKWSCDYYHCPFDSLEDRNYWKEKFSRDDHGSPKGIGRIKR